MRNAQETWEQVKTERVFVESMLHTINEILRTRNDINIGDSFVSILEAQDEGSNKHTMNVLITISVEEYIIRPFFMGVLLEDLTPMVIDAVDVEKYEAANPVTFN
jgi:hypothetical protein